MSYYFEIRHFDWLVDFEKHVISGSVLHKCVVHKSGVKNIDFDASYLDISKVTVNGQTARFELGKRHPVMGNKLSVHFDREYQHGEEAHVELLYSTTAECTALGWLEKE